MAEKTVCAIVNLSPPDHHDMQMYRQVPKSLDFGI